MAAAAGAEVENITIVSAEGERFTVPKKVRAQARARARTRKPEPAPAVSVGGRNGSRCLAHRPRRARRLHTLLPRRRWPRWRASSR